MFAYRKNILRLFQRTDGGVSVEFGLLAPLLFLISIGIVDLGMALFTWSTMEGGLREASRYGITGNDPTDGSTRLDEIKDIVSKMSGGMIDIDTATFDVKAYPTFADVGKAEAFDDANSNGSYDPGEPLNDCNGNGTADADRGRDADAGLSGEVVVYTIEYDYELMTPVLMDLIGEGGKLPLRASVVVRNEPWDTTHTADDLEPCDL